MQPSQFSGYLHHLKLLGAGITCFVICMIDLQHRIISKGIDAIVDPYCNLTKADAKMVMSVMGKIALCMLHSQPPDSCCRHVQVFLL